jgi:GT2 family glycosyltransferase
MTEWVGASGLETPPLEDPGTAADISIVIPCYNARRVLEPCLRSIYRHRPRRPFEVLVVNDASSDGTSEMLRERFPQVRLLENSENLGYSASTNRGIAAAAGRFVHLMNSDVIVYAGAIERLADHLESHPEVGAAGTVLYNADGTVQASVKALPSFLSAIFGARSFISQLWPDNRFTRRELLHWQVDGGGPFPAGYISTASLMVRRDLLRRIGDLDVRFFHFADADLCKRIWDSGSEVVCVPHAGAMHDAHTGGSMASLSRRFRVVAGFHRGAYRYFRKHSGRGAWHPLNAVVAASLGLRLLLSGLVQLGKELIQVFRRMLWLDEPVLPLARSRAESGPRDGVEVTLVVPNYNARAMLERCLESITRDPPARSFEIVVIDDASSDGSAALVRDRYPQARLIANRRNQGYGRSCNLAIAEARGRYVYLVNNDVELLPGVVELLADFLDAHPEAGAAGSLLYNSDGSVQRSVKAHPSLRSAFFGARSFVSRWFPSNPFTRAELLHWRAEEGQPFTSGYVSSASLMVRREEFDRVGDLDVRLTYFNDADFCRRLWKSGRAVYYVPRARAVHHDHKGGTQVSPRRRFLSVIEFHLGAFRYYRRHSGKPAWHPWNVLVVAGLAARFIPCIVIQTVLEAGRAIIPRSGAGFGPLSAHSEEARGTGPAP